MIAYQNMNTLTTIYLIRHGDTAYPTDNTGRRLIYGPEASLTEIGVQQIHMLASRLREDNVRFDKIYTSPYVRTRQSSGILAEDLGVPIPIVKEELIDIGAPHHVGLLWEDISRGNLPIFDDHETHQQVLERIWRVFYEIYNLEIGNTVGVVSHGDPIRVFMYRLQKSDGFLPPIAALNLYDYLNKGEAWKLSIDGDANLVSLDFITTREGRSSRRERED